MPRLKKRELNLKQNKDKENNRENERNENIRRALIFVIALIYCGFPESLSQDFAILIGDHPPTYYFLHLAFDMIRSIVQKLVANSTAKAREEMPEKAPACMDGSWDHKRDGKLLIYDIICIETQKIIDFVLKIRKSEKKQGNTTVSAPALEGEAFVEILPRLRSYSKLNEIVKDGDVQIDSIIRNSGWTIKVTPDPNHLLIHFEDNFKKLIHPHEKMFYGICPKVLKQLKYILYDDTEKVEKLKQIQEMKQLILTQSYLKLGRSLTKHPWKYSHNRDAIEALDKVIAFCNDIALNFEGRHSTCFNETFHALKAKYLPKKFNLGNTSDVRIYCAILHYNEGKFWLKELYEQLNLPLVNVEALERFHSNSKNELVFDSKNQ